jgi:hypothetical protein
LIEHTRVHSAMRRSSRASTTAQWGRHLANGGARSRTACPAVVWPRGKVSAGTVENRENATTLEVPNAGEVSHVRARGCVCVHGFVRLPVAKRGGEPKLSGTQHWNGKEKDSGSKQGSAHVEEGSGTCKATGSARWPTLKRQRVYAVARSGRGPTVGTEGPTSTPGSFQSRLEGRASTEEQGRLASPRWPLADMHASVRRAERDRRR